MDALPPRVRDLPIWTGVVRGEPLHGGLSNESWRVSDANGRHVVRLGRDFPFHHVFRDHEVMVARAAHAVGLAPAVEYAAPGVMVSQFLGAKTWSAEDVQAQPARAAELVATFHTQMPQAVSGAARFFSPFHVIRDYARTVAAGDSPFRKQLTGYVATGNALEVTQIPMPLVFAHNDLLPANILETPDGKLWLIDFEYAAFSTPMFDLAGAASNAGMSAEQAQAFLTAWLGNAPDAAFLRAFDAMQVASLLREAMWAMVSHLHLNAPGADYVNYARQNLEKYEEVLDRFQRTHGKLV